MFLNRTTLAWLRECVCAEPRIRWEAAEWISRPGAEETFGLTTSPDTFRSLSTPSTCTWSVLGSRAAHSHLCLAEKTATKQTMSCKSVGLILANVVTWRKQWCWGGSGSVDCNLSHFYGNSNECRCSVHIINKLMWSLVLFRYLLLLWKADKSLFCVISSVGLRPLQVSFFYLSSCIYNFLLLLLFVSIRPVRIANCMWGGWWWFVPAVRCTASGP